MMTTKKLILHAYDDLDTIKYSLSKYVGKIIYKIGWRNFPSP